MTTQKITVLQTISLYYTIKYYKATSTFWRRGQKELLGFLEMKP